MMRVCERTATLSLMMAALMLVACAATGRAQPPTSSSSAKLIAASVLFHTHGTGKPADAMVAITLSRGQLRVARMRGLRGNFKGNSSDGPYALEVLNPIAIDHLQGLTATVSFAPRHPVTWKFDYDIHLTFSDGTRLVRHVRGVVLTQDASRSSHPLEPAA